MQRSGDAELRRNVEAADTIRLEDGQFRTCISRDDRRRRVCFVVDTRDPVRLRRDPSSAEPEPSASRRRLTVC